MDRLKEMVQGGYVVESIIYPWDQFIKLKRTRCGSVDELKTDYPRLFEVFGEKEVTEFLEGIWDSIPMITPGEAFAEPTHERRAVAFNHIGPARMMEQIDEKYKKCIDVFEAGENFWDRYELWQVDPKAIQLPEEFRQDNLQIVRCWCPSKGTEHWLWVDHRMNFKDAGEAIAWTCLCPIPIEQIEAIYRQGEVYTFEEKPGTRLLDQPVHMTKRDYFRLLKEQT